MQRTLKRESKVLEIAERETIATDHCGSRYDPVTFGSKVEKIWGKHKKKTFFFSFFPLFFPIFLLGPKGSVTPLMGDWASIGSGDDRRPSSKWARRVVRGMGQSVWVGEFGGIFFSLFFTLEPTIFLDDRFGRP